jgi:hypothetical protein
VAKIGGTRDSGLVEKNLRLRFRFRNEKAGFVGTYGYETPVQTGIQESVWIGGQGKSSNWGV